MMLATFKSLFVKSTLTKSLLATMSAGAWLLLTSAPVKGQVVFQAQFGVPVVAAVPAYAYGYYDQRRAYIEREEWLRAHRYDRDYFYDGDRYDRDRYYYDHGRRDRDRDRDDRYRYDRDRR